MNKFWEYNLLTERFYYVWFFYLYNIKYKNSISLWVFFVFWVFFAFLGAVFDAISLNISYFQSIQMSCILCNARHNFQQKEGIHKFLSDMWHAHVEFVIRIYFAMRSHFSAKLISNLLQFPNNQQKHLLPQKSMLNESIWGLFVCF